MTYSEFLDDVPPPRKRGWWRFIGRHLPSFSVALLVSMLAATVLFPYVVITVPSGMVGVLWKRFNGYDLYCWCFVGRGTILDPRELREEGLHIIWPWDKLYLYDLRLQSTNQTYNAISKDGVNVTVTVSIRYQLLHNSIGVLHKFIGPGFLDTVVGPEIGSETRQVISQYTAQQVYTSREEIQEKIRSSAQNKLGDHLNTLVQPAAMEQPDPKHYNDFLQNSIQILDTPVLGIELPPAIVAAINRQTEQFYQIQEFKYRVEREVEEAKRKQVEANGIAAFQKTVSQGISDSYLRWRGIEATLALAQSPNSKIVVIGSGKDGLPIILGNIDNPAPPPAARPATGGSAPTGSLKGPDQRTSTVPPAPADVSAATAAQSESEKKASDIPPSVKSGMVAPLDIDVETLLSRLREALRPSKSATGDNEAKPKP
ncbi:MAG TPA: prohibitin family protein [Pseudolabrys sp.]|nr:prohibitin family protein [Pseudolabrys sp.]